MDTGVSAIGVQGPTGAAGPTGPTGPEPVITVGSNGDWYVDGVDTGKPAQGPAGTSAIVPFASGLPADISMLLAGLAGIPEFLGFGMSSPGVSALGTTINFTGGTLTNFAFTVPRNGTLTDIAGTFNIIAGASVGSMNPTIYVYRAPANSDNFTQLTGAKLVLPDIGLLAIDATVTGTISNVNAPITAGDRLLVVAAATSADGLTLAGTATGYISAGLGLAFA